METKETARNETEPSDFAQQQNPEMQIFNQPENTRDFYESTVIKNELIENEPIDLTFNDRNQFRILAAFPDNFPKTKRIKRKLVPSSDGQLYIVNESNVFTCEPPQIPNKIELMMSAKSLFSKRTRTLYHWMYPNASKQQIKLAVSSAWEALSPQEKDVYVAQVMAKFGFPQSGLMVNPQLGNIRELPPLPEVKTLSVKAVELQNAISSISQEGKKKRKNKSGRTKKRSSKVCKNDSSSVYADLSQDFQDDPELSQELAQFAMFFKNKI